MYLPELNRSLTELDRKIIYYIKEIHQRMYAQAREHALLKAKYPLNFVFNDPVYDSCIIKDLYINLNKNNLISYDNPEIIFNVDYYEPYYVYLVKVENEEELILFNEQSIEKNIVK